MFPFIQCQCFDKKGCLLTVKIQHCLKMRVLFGPEISFLGEFLDFENERMHPPKFRIGWSPSNAPLASQKYLDNLLLILLLFIIIIIIVIIFIIIIIIFIIITCYMYMYVGRLRR